MVREHSYGDQTSNRMREKIAAAMVELVVENGLEETTEQMVIERAGVNSGDFNHFFRDTNDCYVQLFDQMVNDYLQEALEAADRRRDWLENVRVVANRLLVYLEENPSRAYFMAEFRSAGDQALTRTESFIKAMTIGIDAGRRGLDDPESVSPAVAEGLVGATAEIVSARLQAGELENLRELVPQLMYMVVRPYLGEEAARAELRILPP